MIQGSVVLQSQEQVLLRFQKVSKRTLRRGHSPVACRWSFNCHRISRRPIYSASHKCHIVSDMLAAPCGQSTEDFPYLTYLSSSKQRRRSSTEKPWAQSSQAENEFVETSADVGALVLESTTFNMLCPS